MVSKTDVSPDPGDSAVVANCSRRYFEDLYTALHDRARGIVQGKHRLDPMGATSLVHDAFIRLRQTGNLDAHDDHHFVALASLTMRRIIVDRARKLRSEKHGGGLKAVPLTDDCIVLSRSPEELLAIDQILNELAEMNPRRAQVGELLIFGSLRVNEIAPLLKVSTKTIHREVEQLETLFRGGGFGRGTDSR